MLNLSPLPPELLDFILIHQCFSGPAVRAASAELGHPPKFRAPPVRMMTILLEEAGWKRKSLQMTAQGPIM